jgi:hypothetical protein
MIIGADSSESDEALMISGDREDGDDGIVACKTPARMNGSSREMHKEIN